MIALINLTALKNLSRSLKGQKRKFLWDSRTMGFGAYRTSRGHVVQDIRLTMNPTSRTGEDQLRDRKIPTAPATSIDAQPSDRKSAAAARHTIPIYCHEGR